MKASQWKHMAVVFSLACVPIWAQAAPIYYTDWATPGIVNFSSFQPPHPDQVIPNTDADYMWYCDPVTGPTCSGTNSFPNMVEFRYDFYLPGREDTGYPLYLNDAYLSIAADDYFALYVNGNLLTPNGVWHDDTGDHATPFDLTNSLVTGANNEILIFACDGYPPTPRVPPGTSPAGGWDGCPTPTERENNWLLTDGLINLVYNTPGGESVFRADLASGNSETLTVWEARGATMVPEPSTISLILFGAMGGLLLQRKRKRHAHKKRD
jgi:hypothetical protein